MSFHSAESLKHALATSPRIPSWRRWKAPCITAAIAFSLWFIANAGSPLLAARAPDLSGVWELDQDLSDDPVEILRERRGGGIAGVDRWGGRPGGVGGGQPGGMGDAARDMGRSSSREDMLRRIKELRASVEQLEITHTDASVQIVFADGHKLAFSTENKKTAVDTPMGKAEIKAKWRDGSLMVRTRAGRHTTIETYHMTEDGGLLTVLVERSSADPIGVLAYKRIYRPAVEGE